MWTGRHTEQENQSFASHKWVCLSYTHSASLTAHQRSHAPSSFPRKDTKELILQEPSSFFREERSWCSSVSLPPPCSLPQPRPASGVLQTPLQQQSFGKLQSNIPIPYIVLVRGLHPCPFAERAGLLLVAFLHPGLSFSKLHVSLRGGKGRLSQARSRTTMPPSQSVAWLQLLSKPAHPAPAANRDQHQSCAGKLPQA